MVFFLSAVENCTSWYATLTKDKSRAREFYFSLYEIRDLVAFIVTVTRMITRFLSFRFQVHLGSMWSSTFDHPKSYIRTCMSSSSDVVSLIHRSYDQPVPGTYCSMIVGSQIKSDPIRMAKADTARSTNPDVPDSRKPKRVRFPDGEVISNYLEPFRPGRSIV